MSQRYTEDVADASIIQSKPTLFYGTPSRYRKDEDGRWEELNKYVTKEVSERSLDWFLEQWSDKGWNFSKKEIKAIKDIWRVAGSPFISWSNPEFVEWDAKEVIDIIPEELQNYKHNGTRQHYYLTSRRFNESGTIGNNPLYPVGSPDIVALTHPGLIEGKSNGPIELLDELAHGIRFAHPSGFPGLHVTAEGDLNVALLWDTINKIDGNAQHPDFPAHYNPEFQDSVYYSLAKQSGGQPWLDESVIGGQEGEWLPRYGTYSEITGEALSEETVAHGLGAPAALLSVADALTSKTSIPDLEITTEDIALLGETELGRSIASALKNWYGLGTEEKFYGKRAGMEEKFEYATGKEDLIHYNPDIKITNDRYTIAKKNIDEFLSEKMEQYDTTRKAFKKFKTSILK